MVFVVGSGFYSSHSSSTELKTIASPTQALLISPTQIPTTSPIQPSSTPSKYSDALKAKVRSEFINTCNTTGHYAVSVCTCAADSLSKNYSETELAEMFIQYHTSNKIPSAITASINTCSAK